MVGYDGGASAARAVQLFALLELGIGRRVHVVSVGTTKESIEGVPERAGDYLRRRGFEVEVHAIATRTSPIEVLRAEVSRRKIDTLVVGVYGHTGLRARLFGSTTRHLLEDPPSALFVYH
jgi:nucleotide-binding universal stress UspA family protein